MNSENASHIHGSPMIDLLSKCPSLTTSLKVAIFPQSNLINNHLANLAGTEKQRWSRQKGLYQGAHLNLLDPNQTGAIRPLRSETWSRPLVPPPILCPVPFAPVSRMPRPICHPELRFL
ncbi:hypothetical protein CEXT_75571 [Caerostris extrusa]|uniref:Uncharacterized protein n=1 Tax=Caerostris extrusa TaxID=172846 RepID=A0AAV4XRU4_CAEEX|nr:hypothetical protein CEXT_75571 [Caerostris extrusa]